MKCPEDPRKTITYEGDKEGHDKIKYPYVGATCDIQIKDIKDDGEDTYLT